MEFRPQSSSRLIHTTRMTTTSRWKSEAVWGRRDSERHS